MRNVLHAVLILTVIGIIGCASPRLRPLCDSNTWQASFQRDFVTAADAQTRRILFNNIEWGGKTEADVLELLGQPDMRWDPSTDGSRTYGWGRWVQFKDMRAMWYLTLTIRNGRVISSDDEVIDP